MASTQKIFSPINHGFQWTDDGWYTFDRKTAEKAALQERNAYAKAQKALGRDVTKFSLPSQLITRGGIGSGKPQIEVVCAVYGCNVWGV